MIRSTPRRALAAVVVAIALVARNVFGQGTGERDEARQHFDNALRAADELRWQDAITELEAARTIRATAPVYYNLGLAYRAVGRSLDAIHAFESFTAIAGSANDERVQTVNGYVTALRASLAHFSVDVTPANASVEIDGTPVASPGDAHEYDPGPHLVVIQAHGFQGQTRRIALAPASTAHLAFALAQLVLSGRVEVTSNVSRCEIRVDGHAISHGSLTTQLPPGRHTIDVVAEGYREFHGVVNVVADGTSRVSVDLRRDSILVSPWLWAAIGVVATAAVTLAVWQPWVQTPPDVVGHFGHVNDALIEGH